MNTNRGEAREIFATLHHQSRRFAHDFCAAIEAEVSPAPGEGALRGREHGL
jgi:hypothetical protein